MTKDGNGKFNMPGLQTFTTYKLDLGKIPTCLELIPNPIFSDTAPKSPNVQFVPPSQHGTLGSATSFFSRLDQLNQLYPAKMRRRWGEAGDTEVPGMAICFEVL